MQDPMGVNKTRRAALQLRKRLCKVRENMEQGTKMASFLNGMAAGLEKTGKRWIQAAIKHKGALHRQLGVPEGENIPDSKIDAAAEKGGKVGRRARLAQTLRKLHKK